MGGTNDEGAHHADWNGLGNEGLVHHAVLGEVDDEGGEVTLYRH